MELYERLREMLDAHPAGCPAAPEIMEILGILFTEDEARTALGLGFLPSGVEAIAGRAGVSEEEALARLESMADKGIVYARKKDGRMRYAMLPVMPGLFEFPFMKGKRTEELDRLEPLWKKYLGELSKGFGSPGMAFSRIVPVGRTIESVPDVLAYERVEEMIDKAKVVGLAHCACRESEGHCNAPREACMLFDDTCDFLVERGFARYITKEEMKQKLAEFDEKGLVHQVNNASDRVTFICNCCPCCCGLLRAKTVFGNEYVLNASGFIAKSDPDKCTLCGVCADDRCPMDAITIDGGELTVSAELCIGCGLCVTGCPIEGGAISLVRRDKAKKPAASTREMGLAVLMEKGKLDRFARYAIPDAPGK